MSKARDTARLVSNVGVSTIATEVDITNGPLQVGSATSTGTANQPLQVTGGAYVSGNIGIGTTNPTSRLHVAGNTFVTDVLTVGTGLTNYTPTDAKPGGIRLTGGTSSIYQAYIGIDNDGAYFGHNGAGAKLFLQTNETTAITIDANRNILVGNGTTTGRDFYKLSGYQSRILVEQNDLNVASYINISCVLNDDSNEGPSLGFAKSRGLTSGSNTIVQSGDVLGGIVFFGADGAGLVPAAAMNATSDGTPGIGAMPGKLTFFTTPASSSTVVERMSINSTGLITFQNFSGGGATFIFNGTSGSGGYTGQHYIDATAYTIGQNSSSRALRIGSGSGWLTSGVSLAAGGTSWGTYSDERLKTDISDLSNCLESLDNIRCVTYRLIDIDESDSKKRLGVIAQDLVGKYDEAVNSSRRSEDDETEYLSVQYTDLIPVLIKSLQEAKQRIVQLENTVASLVGIAST